MSETDRRLFERLLWGTRGRPYHTDERDPAAEEPVGDRPLPARVAETCQRLSETQRNISVPLTEAERSDLREAAKQLAAYDALVAQLEKERTDHRYISELAYQDRTQLQAERDTLAQQVAVFKVRIAEYEQRPWPACQMLSKGDTCECSLCKTEHQRDVLAQQLQQAQIALDGMVAPEERDQWKRAYEQVKDERDALKTRVGDLERFIQHVYGTLDIVISKEP